jgi:hypothetical protein
VQERERAHLFDALLLHLQQHRQLRLQRRHLAAS